MAWPDSIPDRLSLHQPVNNFATTLATNLTSGQTSIQLSSILGLPAKGLICVDDEVVWYDSISGNTLLNCIRGFDNSYATSHANGARVEVRWVAKHHNDIADLLHTIQSTFGADLLTLNGETYATLKELLDDNTPYVVAKSGSTWTITHTRSRLVAVQAWQETSPNNYTRVTPTSITQTPGSVVVTFGGSVTGVAILH